MLVVIPIVVIAVLILLLAVLGYVKAPTDKAYVISGMSKDPKFVIGHSAIRIPFLQRVDKLELKMISVDVKTKESVPTNEYINVMIDSAVKIKVGTDPEYLKKAAENFLNKNEEYIKESVVDVLEGNIREIIGQMKLEDIVTDRKQFAEKVMENAAPDMARMGLEIISFNIQNVTDENSVIENLGIDRIVTISKSAAISRAESERDIKIARAKAEKEANDAEVESKAEIAAKNNELAIKQADLKIISDQKLAEADAAYKIQEQEQRKTIEIANANADIARREKEAELAEKEIALKEKKLDAEIKKQAEADKFAAQQKADASLYTQQRAADAEKAQRIANAEAAKYEAEKRAEAAKASAEAERFTKEQEAAAVQAQGEAEAEAIRAKGLAEAEAIKAKGEAEAEAMNKRADAYEKYGKAAMTEMIVKILPQMAAEIAKPLESIDKVTIIDGENSGSGVGQMGGYVPTVLAKTIESVKETTGIDIAEIMKADTYDAKVNKNVNITGIPDVKVTHEKK